MANVLCYLHRLLTMKPGRIVKSVFDSLHDLNNQGFPSWVSRSYDLAESYQIDMESCIELSPYQFKELCHERLKNSFIMSWMTDLRDGRESSSILKTYRLYKMNFGTECYLKHISKPKFRIALSKLRASSHDLEVERGRYVRPKLDITERLCISCHVIEDEEHFVTDCVNNREMRKSFFEKISLREPGFANWNNREKFVFLMSCEDPQILSWFSKFLYHSFHTRNLRTSLCV